MTRKTQKDLRERESPVPPLEKQIQRCDRQPESVAATEPKTRTQMTRKHFSNVALCAGAAHVGKGAAEGGEAALQPVCSSPQGNSSSAEWSKPWTTAGTPSASAVTSARGSWQTSGLSRAPGGRSRAPCHPSGTGGQSDALRSRVLPGASDTESGHGAWCLRERLPQGVSQPSVWSSGRDK